MSDLITLECPNCGGKLTITPGTVTLSCDHCGAEHLVRKGAEGFVLEAHARCPQCGRNDRVEKVSAILKAQTHDTSGFTYQTVTTTRIEGNRPRTVTQQVKVPTHSSEQSELARQLVPPQRPRPPAMPRASSSSCAQITGILLLACGAIGFCPALLCATGATGSSSANEVATALIGASLIALLAMAVVAGGVIVLKFIAPKERQANQSKRAAYERELAQYHAQVQQQNQSYELARRRWSQLYYCGRDDCVFVPGSDRSAPIAKLQQYLFAS
jgi:ssDNA-binding Zn-finger/Zn-ribbon topoisomerase 1